MVLLKHCNEGLQPLSHIVESTHQRHEVRTGVRRLLFPADRILEDHPHPGLGLDHDFVRDSDCGWHEDR